MPDNMETKAYVWDLNNPNSPDGTLYSPSPLTTVMYNNKLSDVIGGGCYNGLSAIWDIKEGKKKPVWVSPV